jgi:hypothetical protein
VELCEGSTSTLSCFACPAPTGAVSSLELCIQGAVSSLELCIQGLGAGQSYTACVRSLSHDGFESAPSPWSCWITLPLMIQPFIASMANIMRLLCSKQLLWQI